MTSPKIVDPNLIDQQEFLPTDALWKMGVDQYHALIDSGILTEDNPIELLQGWLIQKMPKNPKHAVVTRLLFDLLTHIMPSGWFVNMQEPITTQESEPEPDLAIVKGEIRDYFTQHPRPDQIACIIEVSDATLHRDRTLKKELYALAEIPIYWIVNLPDQQIEVYSKPSFGVSGAIYQQQQTFDLAKKSPIEIDGQFVGEISVSEIFPS